MPFDMIKLAELLNSEHHDVVSIFESPMRLNTPWNAEQLNSLGKNNSFTLGVKEKAIKVGEFDECEVYQYDTGNFTINVLISKNNNNFTVGFFQYISKNNIIEIERVWQDPTHIGLVRKFITEYLINKFDGILSSDSHTELGEKYWKKLLTYALNKHYKIFMVGPNNTKTPINNTEDIEKHYGNSPEYLKYKFLILKQ